MNIGEEIVYEYLHRIIGCDYINDNVEIRSNGGEIDLIGIKGDTIFLCEVATHINGLRYTHKGNTRNNLVAKFERIGEFVSSKGSPYYKKFKPKYMFFSPIVRISKSEKAKNKLPSDLLEVQKILKNKKIDLEFCINEDFYAIIDELRGIAKGIKSEIKTPVMRLLQIESRRHKTKE